MPRWVLPCLIALFLIPGLFGRDLWPQDAAGFGRMWSMAQGGGAEWLMPRIAGVPATDGGPLPYWLGALFIRVAGSWVGDPNAAAAGNLVWYPVAIIALWLAVFRLARRDEAQPVVSAFGGEASRQEYARLMADVAVLCTVGTLGMIWRLHQTQADGATLAVVATALLSLSLVEWRRNLAAVLTGTCAAALVLTLGALPALALLAAAIPVHLRATARTGAAVVAILCMLAPALALTAAWPALAYFKYPQEAALYFPAWLEHLPVGWPSGEGLQWIVRTGAWFLWPLWPLAAWAVYAWRSSVLAAHLERPLLLLSMLTLALLFAPPPDARALVMLIPPLVALAAFGATTLRRALDNAIDWFAMAMFSLILAFFWAYYLALQLGAPRPMAASIARLVPGYVPHLRWVAVALAIAATFAWVRLIGWRVARRPRVLWRGPLLAAAGVTVIWVGVTMLFLPAVNYVYSYRAFAREVASQLQARGLGQGCVQAHRIPLPERAILAYYGRIRFDHEGSSETCRLALHHESRHSQLDDDPPPGVRGMWEMSWEGRRQARPDEHWRIWVRAQ